MKRKSSLLFIVIVFLLAFLPVVSFVFALKNDFFLSYFPPRFLFSETLRSGQFPLWNPYISFGLPFYGDMNGAYWSPITWLIALTGGYSAYTLTLELLLYVLIGGIGMYKLAEHFTGNNYIRIIAGISYMCNGFVVGHLQHLNWISCSAFLPWCVWGILNINKSGSPGNILFTVLTFYFLISSSHPGMIIGSIYFFFAFVLYLLYQQYKTGRQAVLKNNLKSYTLFLLLLVLLSSGLIAGYTDIVPYFDRNTKVDTALSLVENTTAESWISLLIPFSTTKNPSFFNNDIAFRNNYFGLVFLCFFLASIFTLKLRSTWFYLLTGLFFLLLSMGGPIKNFALNYLPLIGYVRLNAEFRIFAIISFIIAAVLSFDYFLIHKDWMKAKLKLYITGLLIISGLIFSISFTQVIQGNSILTDSSFLPGFPWRESAKKLIDGLLFYDTLLIQSTIQLILLVLLLHAVKKQRIRYVVLIAAIDLIMATNFNLPFTGVGKVPVSTIHSIHKLSPPGTPTPVLKPIKNNDTITAYERALVGEWNFLNKQIGNANPANYPVKISTIHRYYELLQQDSSVSVANNPYLFISREITRSPIANAQNLQQESIQSFGTNHIALQFMSNDTGYLIFLQNHYPHWYYETKNEKNTLINAGGTFMAAPISKGENKIILLFNPFHIKFFFGFSVLLFFSYVICYIRIRNSSV